MILLIIHIHILIFAFLGVLWVRSQLQKNQVFPAVASTPQKDKRKARVLFNDKMMNEKTRQWQNKLTLPDQQKQQLNKKPLRED